MEFFLTANYFLWLEMKSIIADMHFMMMSLDVYSRISYIKNSSFGYDHLIVRQKTGEIIVDGKGVVVFVDPKTRKSTPLPNISRK
ncbi:MAG: hypothetical protein MZV64_65905 [Ignavibacteriales bacterium]|nr:hypothetical protein [Ignavibacteriales bacterium]